MKEIFELTFNIECWRKIFFNEFNLKLPDDYEQDDFLK